MRFELRGRQCSAAGVALHLVASEQTQEPRLFFGFDALGNNAEL
jgi:hypothetical protein